jgi:hypothetical protein
MDFAGQTKCDERTVGPKALSKLRVLFKTLKNLFYRYHTFLWAFDCFWWWFGPGILYVYF